MINDQTRELLCLVLDWHYNNFKLESLEDEKEFVTLAKKMAVDYMEENHGLDIWGADSVDRADAYYSRMLGY